MENMHINDYPMMLSAKDAQKFSGMSRAMVYRLLNRNDLPVVEIGGRKFMHRDLFMKWLEEQATKRGA